MIPTFCAVISTAAQRGGIIRLEIEQ